MIKSSNILIIGAGVSSIFPILLGKNKVTIINEGKLFSRILISGNGRCNFFNDDLLNKEDVNLKLILNDDEKNYPNAVLNYIKNDLGIDYYKEKKYYYPFFNKSECFYNPLIEAFNNSNANLILGRATSIDPIKKKVVYLENDIRNEISYQKLIISTGGFSYLYKQDYSLINSLNIKFNKFSPSLCPIKIKEKIPSYLVGLRLKATVYLLIDDKKAYCEEGEVLFKKDGLSGIVIFNISKVINEYINKSNIKIQINYLNHDGYQAISKKSLPEALKKYLKEENLLNDETLTFSFSSLYSFKESQASYGGISLDEINLNNFTLKKYPDIYAIGEVIDLNFKCGGYNIGYNMIEGYKVINRIIEDERK